MPSQGGVVVQRILEILDAHEGEPLLEGEARAVADAYGPLGSGPLPGTTHISVVDGEGMAAGLSSTLGSGSGVFRAGTQLNNMLGELDVIGAGEKAAGDRLPSMMTPTLVLDEGRPQLVLGSAGSVRLAGAIAQVTWRFLRGMHVADAIAAPRLHVEGTTLHLEGGWPERDVAGSARVLGRQPLGRSEPLLRRRAGRRAFARRDLRRRRATRGGAAWGSWSHDERQAGDPARRERPRRARRERRARGGQMDPRHRTLAGRRRRAALPADDPALPGRRSIRGRGRRHDRRAPVALAGSAPGEPDTSPTSGSWLRRAPQAGRRHGPARGGRRHGRGSRRPQARAARLSLERAGARALRGLRIRARGLPEAALRARRRARRRHPHGVLRRRTSADAAAQRGGRGSGRSVASTASAR